MDIRVYDTADHVAHHLADYVAETLNVWDGPSTLGLAGGSTPPVAYAMFPELDVDWANITCWLGDERWVPPDHEDSNVRMARKTFVDTTGATLLAPPFDDHGPAVAADRYAKTLSRCWVDRGDGRRPDLVLLGMGDDGHTASLFPGSAALREQDRDYTAVFVAERDMWRITATLSLLATARQIAFVVTGDAKADAIRRVLTNREPLPAALVSDSAPKVAWFLDTAAARHLTSTPI